MSFSKASGEAESRARIASRKFRSRTNLAMACEAAKRKFLATVQKIFEHKEDNMADDIAA
jgi:hypothetical protein